MLAGAARAMRHAALQQRMPCGQRTADQPHRPRAEDRSGAADVVTLLADGRLERVNTGTGEKLTYSKG
jgi:hypothetical protein